MAKLNGKIIHRNTVRKILIKMTADDVEKVTTYFEHIIGYRQPVTITTKNKGNFDFDLTYNEYCNVKHLIDALR